VRRLLLAAVTASLCLAGLGLMLRHDLALLAWREGRQALAGGEHQRALRALQRAAQGGRQGSAQLAFDTGIALYRLEDFPRARALFALASAADEPRLRTAALYNSGNCAFREAEQKAASDRGAAGILLQQASLDYGRALAADPGAADARQNLALARTRLAALQGAGEGEGGTGPAKPGGARGAKDGGGKESPPRTGKTEGEQGEARGERAPGRTPGKPASRAAQQGKPRPQLTRDHAERLLSEARGREAFAARLPGSGGAARLAPPDKDW